MNKVKVPLFLVVCLMAGWSPCIAANMANPAVPLPPARISVGASYHLGGYSLTNLEIPSLFNRIHGRVEYCPLRYLSIGIDGGTMKIDVDRFRHNGDSVPIFHGDYGYSGGGHLKVSTPSFFQNQFTVIAIGQATLFNSENTDVKAGYKGKDASGVIGIQYHIPGFGYITAGPLVYVIQGENKSFDGKTRYYSNADNIRGWCSIDYFPKVADVSNNKPYISFEFSISPSATFSRQVPFQAFSASISIGSITKRLYGTESEVEWNP